jgi:hypothetical protein
MATLEIQGIGRVQVDDSFKTLPPDKQQQVVAEIVGKVGGARVGKVVNTAAEMQPTKTERGMQEAARVFSQPNQMIADVVGAPVDVVNWGLRQIGVGGDKPVMGSEWIKGQMEGLGVPVGITPQTPEGRVAGQALSGAVATLAPYALAQKFVGSASPVVSGIAQAVGTQPGAQIAAGAGAGAGGQIAEEVAPGNTWARLAGIFGGAMAGGGLAARLNPANPAGQPTKEMLGAFERQGVTPTLGAVGGPSTKIVQQTLASIPGAAGIIAKGAKRSLDETGAAVGRLSDEWAGPTGAGTKAETGQVLQGAVERFAQDAGAGGALTLAQIIARPAAQTSFRTKANALYERVGALIPTKQEFSAWNTGRALAGIMSRFNSAPLQEAFQNSTISRWAQAYAQTNGRVSWNDLRQFRSEVGEMIAQPVLAAKIGRAQLENLYAGLSRDIEAAARTIGPAAERALTMADRFYRTGMDRINNQLNKFFKAESPEGAWQKLITAAGEKGGASVGRIHALKRSLPQEEWDQVAATILGQMGQPTPGARLADEAFSASTFLTNYSAMSPAARDAIFKGSGRQELASALDDLVNVVTAQKGLEKMANFSGTGRVALTGGLGALALSQPFTAAFTVIGARAAAKLMTSPAVVRWLAKAPAAAGTPTVWARQLRGLQSMAKNDPALAQALLAFERALMAGEAQGAAQQPATAPR